MGEQIGLRSSVDKIINIYYICNMISNRIVEKNNVAGGGVTTNLWGWGNNQNNLITNGGTGIYSSPVMANKYGSSNTYSWLMVSNGDGFACGIDFNNTLVCWGINNYGQIGNGNTNTVTGEFQHAGNWKSVSCGTNHVLALNNSNKLFTWGRNNKGQLGDGTTVNKSSPVQIGTDSWIKISASHEFSAAIKYNLSAYRGYLFTWGENGLGQLGDGTTNNRTTPTQIIYGYLYPSYMWEDITTGYAHCLAIANNYFSGKFFAWGDNTKGQLGNGNNNLYSSPVLVNHPTNQQINKIEACGRNSAFIDANSSLYLFGQGTYGQIGNNSTADQNIPTFITSNFYQVQMVAKTKNKVSTFAINSPGAGRLYSWGYNVEGVLGDGTTVNKSSPVQVGSANDWYLLSITSGGIGTKTMFALKY